MSSISGALVEQLKLPACVGISTGFLQNDLPILSSDEQASIGSMSFDRLREFSHGRMHARLALAQLGLTDASIPVANDRSPSWPPGVVGSISHVPADRLQKHPGRVIAVVARRSDCNGLGIDLERTGRLQPEQWPVFMTGGELDRLSLCSFDQRGAIAHGLWSAKEASMKALCQPLEPQAIEIQMFEDGRSFTAQCRVSLDAGHEDKVTLSGSLAHMDVWVLALVIR